MKISLLEAQLRIKKSTLPGAGKGLFTTQPIPRGTRIVEYRGTVTTWKDSDHRDGANGYIYYINRGHTINALPHPQFLARYANDAKGLSRVRHLRNNCCYRVEGLHVYIVAMKAISAGSELLVGYGKEYWDAIRYNLRHGFAK